MPTAHKPLPKVFRTPRYAPTVGGERRLDLGVFPRAADAWNAARKERNAIHAKSGIWLQFNIVRVWVGLEK